MRHYHIFILLLNLCINCTAQDFDWKSNTSPSYVELIEFYKKCAKENKSVELYNMGNSDAGIPIYLCIYNGAGDSLKTFQKARKSTTLLVNNAIHAGEPDGVNASAMWLLNLMHQKSNTNDPLIAIIPAYNVGGMLNRNSTSRANQDGPEVYGFRGSARNYDLNRDFIKMDAQNTFTFAKIFHTLDPDVFVDTHVSNGADYTYTLTYISSMKERMAPSIKEITYEALLPELNQKLALYPYVELKGRTPEDGIVAFNDLPRYAMGYANLFNAISFTVETHMLKPFPERVLSTYDFINELHLWLKLNSKKVELAREHAFLFHKQQEYFKFNYTLSSVADSILFKGYKATYPVHPVTQLPRLNYDRNQRYERFIPYYNTHFPKDSIRIPDFYIIKGSELEVINRLQQNEVAMERIIKGSAWLDRNYFRDVEIKSFQSYNKPYEGHFKHHTIEVDSKLILGGVSEGDYVISTQQNKRLFICSVLEPLAEDSYFSWNFFDSYLQQKEYFSSYVFIDKIAEILEKNPSLKQIYEEKKKNNQEFRESETLQLNFIYEHSAYFEPSYMKLPILKFFKAK